ncbi:ATP-binding cassette domain-containing protein [Metasolibacillus fluoroglycofenilyticus]|uniref:ATP-binding cassette domain-containing protein n=1 Tax=Metasolibacillus fluoroglycofenilyticus TaxID=1239396 RepID=UPI000D3816C4|nr:ATP-binding cassette domain-containing protein [Metasolibacillus fluoroglycofenilyticus]
MTNQILIKNLTFQYDSMTKPIFKNLNFNMHEHWRLGLVGRNGRGKTTFFRLLLNELEYEGNIQTNLRFHYFPSYPEEQVTVSTLFKDAEIWKIEQELALMNLPVAILNKQFAVLSGGEQTKILLIALFLNEQTFPLIDEPTNNLDLQGRKIVGQYLKRKKGFIVISHDESFLNEFVDHVLAINKQSIDLYKGNIATWKYEKANADLLTEEMNGKLKNEINRLDNVARRVSDWGIKKQNSTNDASARRIAAKHMKRSKAIKKRSEALIEEKRELIDNIEKLSVLKMHVLQPRKQILYFRDFTLIQDGLPLFQPITIDVYPNDRFFIEGGNGAGKSSLLKFILGVKQFETTGNFSIHLPKNISIFHQKNADNENYLCTVDQLTKIEKEEYWHILHQLGIERSKFTDKSSETWSAGQEKKALLAKALLGQNELFAWDEVTNHLDMLAIEQLIAAIQKYGPTMIGIDHNEHYMNAIATKKIKLFNN